MEGGDATIPLPPGAEIMSAKKPNRTYTSEFIQETLKLVREEKRSVGKVAKSLGVPHSTIHTWLRKFPAAAGSVSLQQDLLKENNRLKEELRQAKLECAILKKATAYFAKDAL